MKAVSYLEVLIVMAIFSMMVVLTFPYSIRLINQSRADAEAKTIAYVLFRQQQDAYSGFNNKPYGVALFSDRYTTFTGTSLATAESQDTYYLSSPIVLSSIALNIGNEIVFASGTFRPISYGNLLITDSKKVYRIDINQEGLISYYGQ